MVEYAALHNEMYIHPSIFPYCPLAIIKIPLSL
jgi:hypothetical protein